MPTPSQFPLAQPASRISTGNPVWMDGLRIALGLFLFVKGLSFLSNTTDIYYWLIQQSAPEGIRKASIFVSFFHIVGGLMIASGTLTRLALMCQFPILLGAVFVVNFRRGLTLDNVELWVSSLVLVLIIFFMIVGPGRYSIDHKVFQHDA